MLSTVERQSPILLITSLLINAHIYNAYKDNEKRMAWQWVYVCVWWNYNTKKLNKRKRKAKQANEVKQ